MGRYFNRQASTPSEAASNRSTSHLTTNRVAREMIMIWVYAVELDSTIRLTVINLDISYRWAVSAFSLISTQFERKKSYAHRLDCRCQLPNENEFEWEREREWKRQRQLKLVTRQMNECVGWLVGWCLLHHTCTHSQCLISLHSVVALH